MNRKANHAAKEALTRAEIRTIDFMSWLVEGQVSGTSRRQQDRLGHFLRRRFFVFLGGDLREAAVF